MPAASPSSEIPKPGDQVRTPSGAQAEVVVAYPEIGEVLVQWTTGDRARFRLVNLRPAQTAQDASGGLPATLP